MYISTFTILAGLVASTVAIPKPASYVLHEKREYDPPVWHRDTRLDGNVLLPMRIGLTQQNLDKGHEMLMEVSMHDSPKYGQHYTAEEIIDIFAPSVESVNIVKTWLSSAGIPLSRVTQSANKQWLEFQATASEAEDLLHAEYFNYVRKDTGYANIACQEYHVPPHIQAHIDYVTPGIKLHSLPNGDPESRKRAAIKKRELFGDSKASLSERGALEQPNLLTKPVPASILPSIIQDSTGACGTYITPQCFSVLYNVTAAPAYFSTSNKMGIFEDLNDVYNQNDLNLFFQNLYPTIPQGTHPKLEAVDGAVAPAPAVSGDESLLDFQLAYPIVYPQTIVLFQTDDPVVEANYNYNGFLNNFLDAIDGSYCSYSAFGETGNANTDPAYPDPQPGGYKGKLQCGVYKPTNVISISYNGPEGAYPPAYQKRQCNEYMKLGMQGVSVIVSSGDYGVQGSSTDATCLGTNHNIFDPTFPSTCPYITVMGATTLPPGANGNIDAETAVTAFGSGGGFSNIYPIPSYQASALSQFYAVNNPPYPYYSAADGGTFGTNGGVYNRSGRGIPDFASVGQNILVYLGGVLSLIGGTSAAAPGFGALINRINEERIHVGKGPVGFVNPTLYANPGVFHDITVGNNPGCGSNGFSCGPGWDPVTGLGTPDYPKLLSLFMSLP